MFIEFNWWFTFSVIQYIIDIICIVEIECEWVFLTYDLERQLWVIVDGWWLCLVRVRVSIHNHKSIIYIMTSYNTIQNDKQIVDSIIDQLNQSEK